MSSTPVNPLIERYRNPKYTRNVHTYRNNVFEGVSYGGSLFKDLHQPVTHATFFAQKKLCPPNITVTIQSSVLISALKRLGLDLSRESNVLPIFDEFKRIYDDLLERKRHIPGSQWSQATRELKLFVEDFLLDNAIFSDANKIQPGSISQDILKKMQNRAALFDLDCFESAVDRAEGDVPNYRKIQDWDHILSRFEAKAHIYARKHFLARDFDYAKSLFAEEDWGYAKKHFEEMDWVQTQTHFAKEAWHYGNQYCGNYDLDKEIFASNAWSYAEGNPKDMAICFVKASFVSPHCDQCGFFHLHVGKCTFGNLEPLSQDQNFLKDKRRRQLISNFRRYFHTSFSTLERMRTTNMASHVNKPNYISRLKMPADSRNAYKTGIGVVRGLLRGRLPQTVEKVILCVMTAESLRQGSDRYQCTQEEYVSNSYHMTKTDEERFMQGLYRWKDELSKADDCQLFGQVAELLFNVDLTKAFPFRRSNNLYHFQELFQNLVSEMGDDESDWYRGTRLSVIQARQIEVVATPVEALDPSPAPDEEISLHRSETYAEDWTAHGFRIIKLTSTVIFCLVIGACLLLFHPMAYTRATSLFEKLQFHDLELSVTHKRNCILIACFLGLSQYTIESIPFEESANLIGLITSYGILSTTYERFQALEPSESLLKPNPALDILAMATPTPYYPHCSNKLPFFSSNQSPTATIESDYHHYFGAEDPLSNFDPSVMAKAESYHFDYTGGNSFVLDQPSGMIGQTLGLLDQTQGVSSWEESSTRSNIGPGTMDSRYSNQGTKRKEPSYFIDSPVPSMKRPNIGQNNFYMS
ncbi:hypothetical protein GQ44DRAFT_727985 [Phaeosphaeriaceae sp. PMI808]|nr:hypothetical protein GQ44DRAFT_727985 [Phaeosphaeriaceae sp. PMI808]